MSRCRHCKAEIFWALREGSSNTNFMRPLEAKGEALIPEPGEVVIDLIDGEWRAVPVPSVRLHKFHDCPGMPQPRTNMPRPAVRPEPARPSVVFHDALPYEDDNQEVMVVVQQRSKPDVPGAREIRARRREEAERERRHRMVERFWASDKGKAALSSSCPKCLVAVDERCISVAKNVSTFGTTNTVNHPQRKKWPTVTVQYELPFSTFELGERELSQMDQFLTDNPDLFTKDK